MNYNWLFFDLDGTLTDSVSDICLAVNQVLNEYGYKVSYTDLEMKKFIGDGSLMLIKRALAKFSVSKEKLEEIHIRYKEIYSNIDLKNTKIFPNAKEVLEELKLKGYKLGVISNKPDFDTKRIINLLFSNIFDIIIGGSNKFKLKPASEVMNYLIAKYDILRNEVLYIGDMPADEEFAINSKVDFCYAGYGYSNKVSKYNFKINSFAELKEIL